MPRKPLELRSMGNIATETESMEYTGQPVLLLADLRHMYPLKARCP